MARMGILKKTPWGRIVWMLQIVMAGYHELEANDRRQFTTIARKAYRDRHLDPTDRQRLYVLVRKVGRGAARGARGGGMPRFRRR